MASRHNSVSLLCFTLLLGTWWAGPAAAQNVIKLSNRTVNEFDQYAGRIESELRGRWEGKAPFLFIEDESATLRKVDSGDLFIRQMSGDHPVNVFEGLIHDWLGAVYIPHTNMTTVLDILQNFDEHKDLYPQVTASRTISRTPNEVTGYWRLERKGLVPVILDVEQGAHYSQLAPGKWKCEAFARKINEIDTGLFSRGRTFPAGEGHGYLWRMNSYWSLEAKGGGVLAECRTLSLSRDIPQGLAWAVEPYVQKMPEESLQSTLRATRSAALGAH